MEFKETLLPYLDENEANKLLEALEKGVPTHCALLNVNKISDEEFLLKCPNAKVHPSVPHCYIFDKAEYDLGKSLLFEEGAIYIQEPSAAIPGSVLPINSGDRVLDMCAAPGGKTTALSLKEKNATIISNDLSHERSLALSSNVERMGLANVVVSNADFAKHAKDFREYFDVIMLDAPCSGSGTFRKDKEALDDWTYAKVLRCQSIQKELLDIAYSMLKAGGTICYSTCSFSYEEDEGVVLPFLKKHPDMEPVEVVDCAGYTHSSALKEAVHILPSSFEGEGQFFCLLRKGGKKLDNQTEKKEKCPKFDKTISEYGLNDFSIRIIGKGLYALKEPIRTAKLPIIRYGMKVLDVDSPFIPDHHLALSGLVKNNLSLSDEDTKKYLAGESFKVDSEDGIFVACYENRPLGWCKVVGKTLKNHYPKGKRRKRDSILL